MRLPRSCCSRHQVRREEPQDPNYRTRGRKASQVTSPTVKTGKRRRHDTLQPVFHEDLTTDTRRALHVFHEALVGKTRNLENPSEEGKLLALRKLDQAFGKRPAARAPLGSRANRLVVPIEACPLRHTTTGQLVGARVVVMHARGHPVVNRGSRVSRRGEENAKTGQSVRPMKPYRFPRTAQRREGGATGLWETLCCDSIRHEEEA